MIKNNILYSSGTDWTFDLAKAEGVYLWDKQGNKLLDFTSGWNVASLGWNNLEIAEALSQQVKKNVHATLDSTEETQALLAQKLTSLLPPSLSIVGKATGGTEADEEALKTARAFTKRKKIIGFRETYHGQSFAAMTVGYAPEYTTAIAPMLGGVVQMEYPQTYRTEKSEEEVLAEFAKKLEDILKKEDVAAIMTEPGILTGWGSTYVAPKGYLKMVRKLTEKYGTLLIVDEVGTGFSRVGKLLGIEVDGVTPDIFTCAKAFSNGAGPIGAMVTRKDIAETTWTETNLTSTFGWLPLPCIAALKVIEIHTRDAVWEKAATDGEYLRKTLTEQLKNNPYVGDIRGWGMEIGVDFVTDKKTKEKNTSLLKKVVENARKNGLFLNSDGESNIQLMPPLIIERKDLDRGIDILVDTINQASKLI